MGTEQGSLVLREEEAVAEPQRGDSGASRRWPRGDVCEPGQPRAGSTSQISPTCEPVGEAPGERVGEARLLPWSSARIHGRKRRPMALIRQVGITSQELDELVDQERWRQWCLAEPDLS